MANAHRRRNHLKRIIINGEWFYEETALRNEVSKALKGLISANEAWLQVLVQCPLKDWTS